MRSLTWHIVKKDFRHQRLLLVLWWVVLVLRACYLHLYIQNILHWEIGKPTPISLNTMGMLASLLTATDVLLVIFIAAGLVRSDSPIKDRAHWRTLPGSGRQFLAAKFIFCALFCLGVPALISIATKVAYGFPVNEWLAGLGGALLVVLALIAATMSLYSLFLRPLYVLGIYGVLYILGLAAFAYYARESGLDDNLAAGLIIGLVTVILVPVAMYQWRNRKIGGLIMATGLTLAHLSVWLMGIAGYNLNQSLPGKLPVAPMEANLKVTEAYFQPDQNDPVATTQKIKDANGDVYYDTFNHFSNGGEDYAGRIFGDISGNFPQASPTEVWMFADGDAQLSWPHDASQKPQDVSMGTFSDARLPENFPAALQALGLGNLVDPAEPSSSNWMLATLSDNQKNHLAKEPARWQGNITYSAGPLTRLADLPLTPHAVVQNGLNTLMIGGMSYKKGLRNEGWLVMWINAFQLEPGPDLFANISLSMSPNDPEYTFVLWNPKRREVIPGKDGGGCYFMSFGQKTDDGNGLRLSECNSDIEFSYNYRDADGSIHQHTNAETQAWMADARLVELSFTPTHAYRVAATLDPFVLPPQPSPTNTSATASKVTP